MAFRTHRIFAVLAVAAAVMTCGATAPHAAASTGPSMLVNGDDTDTAVQTPDNGLTFYWAAEGTSTWQAETVAGPGTTYSAPAMILNGNTIGIASAGSGGSLNEYWTTNGSSTWTLSPVAPAGSVG